MMKTMKKLLGVLLLIAVRSDACAEHRARPRRKGAGAVHSHAHHSMVRCAMVARTNSTSMTRW